jgi:hypothetical protein
VSHLHSFVIGDALYGTHLDDYPDEEIDETTVSVANAIGSERRFSYQYDFGDSWEHEVVVEATSTSAIGLKFAVCLDGQNACPPEDCGGAPGFADLVEVLADPSHEEHDDFLTWVGGAYDPTTFDLAAPPTPCCSASAESCRQRGGRPTGSLAAARELLLDCAATRGG